MSSCIRSSISSITNSMSSSISSSITCWSSRSLAGPLLTALPVPLPLHMHPSLILTPQTVQYWPLRLYNAFLFYKNTLLNTLQYNFQCFSLHSWSLSHCTYIPAPNIDPWVETVLWYTTENTLPIPRGIIHTHLIYIKHFLLHSSSLDYCTCTLVLYWPLRLYNIDPETTWQYFAVPNFTGQKYFTLCCNIF